MFLELIVSGMNSYKNLDSLKDLDRKIGPIEILRQVSYEIDTAL
jgi:hypothetical protein